MKQRDTDLHREAFELFVRGSTLGEIASELGVSPNTLKYWKSAKCQCQCGYHNWLDFKKKLEAQVPQTIQTVVDAACDALIPVLTAKQMVKRLESICAHELNRPEGLRPKTWKELIETFKLLVDLRRTYGIADDDDDDEISVVREISETHTFKGKVELHSAIDSFVKGINERKKKNQGEVVDLLIDQSKEGV